MNLKLVCGCLLLLLLCSCSSSTSGEDDSATQDVQLSKEPTSAPTAVVTELKSISTSTLSPTNTPVRVKPTETPTIEPRATASPTELSSPTPIFPPDTAAPGTTWIRPIDGMVMIYIPSGEFEMGSSEAELDAALEQCERDRGQGRCNRAWFHDESPRHSVTVDAFWIDRTEVTNTQFATFLNERGNQTEGSATWLDLNDESSLIEQVDGEFRPKTGYDVHPAIEVTWYGALAYCQWVGGWLPSEARWEYVARGPERTDYPWGNEAPTCNLANVSGCQGNLSPVGSYPEGASSYGTLDMAGNVFEWVSNWAKAYPGTQYDNPEFGTIYKVVRGGSWYFLPYYARAAHRAYALMPDISDDFVGFRCLMSLE